jgi:hypothetical protein
MLTSLVADEPKNVTYPFLLSNTLYKRAKAFAEKKGITLAGLLRMALIAFLDKEEHSA